MDIVTKMSIVGALVVLFVIMTIVIVSCNNSAPVVDNPGLITTDEPDVIVDDTPKDYARIVGVVSNVDSDSDLLWVTNVESSDKIIIKVPTTLSIKDAFGSSIALNQLDVGQLIESKYDKNTMTADELKVSNLGFEYGQARNMVVDEENKTISLNNDTYFYTEDIIVYFGGEMISLSELDPVDELIVRGYKDTVWSITLKNKHGYVVLIGTASFIGGTVEISKTYTTITEDTRITVPVGAHDVIITKAGSSPYVTSVTVMEEEEVTIDLSSIQTEYGAVQFKIIQDGSTLYVDDVKIPSISTPLDFTYGSHDIKVENPGFLPLNTTLVVTQSYQEYVIDFENQDLMVNVTGPLETDLYIDAVFVGVIPIQVPISQGTHTFKLERVGYFSKVQDVSVDIESGVYEIAFPELIINANYAGEDITIQIDSPVGCELYIGTQFIGVIPVSALVEPGEHQITIRKDGYYTKLYSISIITGGEPYQYSFPDLIPIGETDENNGGDPVPDDGTPGADVY